MALSGSTSRILSNGLNLVKKMLIQVIILLPRPPEVPERRAVSKWDFTKEIKSGGSRLSVRVKGFRNLLIQRTRNLLNEFMQRLCLMLRKADGLKIRPRKRNSKK